MQASSGEDPGNDQKAKRLLWIILALVAGLVAVSLVLALKAGEGTEPDLPEPIGPGAVFGETDGPLAAHPAPGPPSTRCLDALADVEGAGLFLPEETEFRCPGNTESFPGDRQHWGVACWRNDYYCRGGSWIAVNPRTVGPDDDRLRHVIAHETCHILDYAAGGVTSESSADACASRVGFPRT